MLKKVTDVRKINLFSAAEGGEELPTLDRRISQQWGENLVDRRKQFDERVMLRALANPDISRRELEQLERAAQAAELRESGGS